MTEQEYWDVVGEPEFRGCFVPAPAENEIKDKSKEDIRDYLRTVIKIMKEEFGL